MKKASLMELGKIVQEVLKGSLVEGLGLPP